MKSNKLYILLITFITLISVTYYWWYSNNSLKKVILYKLIENNSENLKRIYSNTVWKKYHIIFELFDDNIYKIFNSTHFQHFVYDTRNFFHDANIVEVLIYNKYNELLFSLNEEYQHNQQDHIIQLNKNTIYEDITGDVISSLPIFSPQNNTDKPDAIIELKHDVNSLNEQINHIYFSYLVAIIVLIGASLTAIYYTFVTNQNALNKQYAVNVKLKIAKESAEKNNVKKSIFLANISHELKTPLNSIIGFSQLIGENPDDNVNNHLDHINEIHNAGVHLLDLINDILDFSKTEVNKLSIDNSYFDLNKVVKSSVAMVTPRAQKYNLNLKMQLPEEPTITYADARRMKQILLNLLSNALKFTTENGTITISVTTQPKHTIIIIQDTGIGIADKDIAQAMSTFGQTDNHLSRRYEGTGLGLPLSKNLIELMGGEFKMQSRENQGTNITITFPRAKAKKNYTVNNTV